MFQNVTAALALSAAVLAEDPPPEFSLPTEEDVVAWRQPGFRLQLGALYDRLYGVEDSPSAELFGGLLRVGARLSDRWSLFGSFQYAGATSGSFQGLQYLTTLDPTWHVFEYFDVALGVGAGGFVEAGGCSGVGPAGLVRLGSMWVLGPRSSVGVALELNAQMTSCTEDTHAIDPKTDEHVVSHYSWTHVGGRLALVVAWR